LKYLVTNGSSITKGGGFENYQYRQGVRDFYKSKGVEVPMQDECTYTYHLGKLLNSQPINLAKCGSGMRRLVRTSYDWINNNLDKLKDTTFIFELQEGIRMEIFLTEYNKFGVVNGFIGEPEWGEDYHMVMNWFEDDISPDKLTEKYKSKLNMFFAFVEKMNLNYYVSASEHNVDKIYTMDKSKVINLDGHSDIWTYTQDKKLLIEDEIGFDDNHIGLEGGKVVAEKLHRFINENS
jgi:hypothetical protein